MTHRIPSAPPYFESRLDFWKSCLLFFLFAILLFSALFWRYLQPTPQAPVVEAPRTLPPIRLETVPTLAPTQTPFALVATPLAQLGQDGAATAISTPTAINPIVIDVAATSAAIETSLALTAVAATTTAAAPAVTPTAIAVATAPPVVEAPPTVEGQPTVQQQPDAPTAEPTPTIAVAVVPSPVEFPTPSGSDLALEASLIPLTLSYPPPNAALPASVVVRLEGTGAPGTLVTVNHLHCSSCSSAFADRRTPHKQSNILMQPLGSALVDARGRWQLPLSQPLPSGQHYILLTQTRADGTEIANIGVSFTVLEEAVGPLALSIPMITFPAPAALIDLSQLEGEQLIFHGAALPGQRIQLYINGSFAGEALTDTAESWHIPVMQLLSPGSYIAHVFALDPNGNVVAESAPAAFVILRQNRG